MLQVFVYALSTVALGLIFVGLYFASNRRRHVPLMLWAFALDMIGLVIVEFVIPRVEKSQDAVTGLFAAPTAMNWVHATFATASVVCYVLQILSGRKLLKADRAVLPGHRRVARVFLITRVLAYITMFMV